MPSASLSAIQLNGMQPVGTRDIAFGAYAESVAVKIIPEVYRKLGVELNHVRLLTLRPARRQAVLDMINDGRHGEISAEDAALFKIDVIDKVDCEIVRGDGEIDSVQIKGTHTNAAMNVDKLFEGKFTHILVIEFDGEAPTHVIYIDAAELRKDIYEMKVMHDELSEFVYLSSGTLACTQAVLVEFPYKELNDANR